MKHTDWDENFLKGINAKDTQAWEKLYLSFYGSLCNYAFGVLKSREVAEDIVQDTLMSVWNSSFYFPDVRSMTVYFYRSVHNNALKYLRDEMADTLHLQKYFEEKESEVDDASLYQAIEEELVRKLRVAISMLPAQQRQILMLSIEGLSVQGVADKLQISINTVKTQKKRAYAALKVSLKAVYLLLILLDIWQ